MSYKFLIGLFILFVIGFSVLIISSMRRRTNSKDTNSIETKPYRSNIIKSFARSLSAFFIFLFVGVGIMDRFLSGDALYYASWSVLGFAAYFLIGVSLLDIILDRFQFWQRQIDFFKITLFFIIETLIILIFPSFTYGFEDGTIGLYKLLHFLLGSSVLLYLIALFGRHMASRFSVRVGRKVILSIFLVVVLIAAVMVYTTLRGYKTEKSAVLDYIEYDSNR